jgi:hypothetical protein
MKAMDAPRKPKAQVSIEFMVIFVIFMFVITIAAAYVMQNTEAVYISSASMESENVLSVIKSKMDTTFLEGDGFSTSFSLPEKIMAFNYTISINSGYALLELNNQTYSKRLLCRNITGSLRKGQNSIMNKDGLIVIS